MPNAPSIPASLAGADLLTVTQLNAATLLDLFELARRMKADYRHFRTALDGKTVILLFEKPSLRTKITFETGVAKMGGIPLYMDHSSSRLGEREAVKDYGLNLERWVECIVARVFKQTVLEELADAAKVPVINALSDRYHPCQALADLFTLWERPGGLEKQRVAYVGDGNNVCHSLMHAAALLGVDVTAITPPGCEPADDVVAECERIARSTNAKIGVTNDPGAVAGHTAVYTDVWTSMGADHTTARSELFAPYQVSEKMMAAAAKDAPVAPVFMHCLPAKRGQEVTNAVIDSPASVVYDQAENRMHAQNALLLRMLAPDHAI